MQRDVIGLNEQLPWERLFVQVTFVQVVLGQFFMMPYPESMLADNTLEVSFMSSNLPCHPCDFNLKFFLRAC